MGEGVFEFAEEGVALGRVWHLLQHGPGEGLRIGRADAGDILSVIPFHHSQGQIDSRGQPAGSRQFGVLNVAEPSLKFDLGEASLEADAWLR